MSNALIRFGDDLPPCGECGGLCAKGSHGEIAVCFVCLARTFDGKIWVHHSNCKCEACLLARPPQRHIDFEGKPRCGVELRPVDPPMTVTAMASDCDACRGHEAVSVALTTDVLTGARKPLGVHSVPQWEPQSLPNADSILEYVARRRSD